MLIVLTIIVTATVFTAIVYVATQGCSKEKAPLLITQHPEENKERESQNIESLDVTDWKTYRNEKYGFEFKFPNDWARKDHENNITSFQPSEQFKEDRQQPKIIITTRPNPEKSSIEAFYDGKNERNLFSHSEDNYTSGKIAGQPYYKFEPIRSFVPEVIVVIQLNRAFIELTDFGATHQQDGIFDSMFSTFQIL